MSDDGRFLRWLDHTGLVAAAYLALALLFYAPLVLGLRTFPDGDFTHHFLPFSLFQQSEILAGRLPVWNPYTYGGHPFLADIQSGVFYPISNLVLGLTLPLSSPAVRLYFLQLEAILQIAMAGFFTFLLLRDLTGNRWAAFLAGAIFAFSGYLTGYPPVQLAVLRTAIWLPLIFWLIWRAYAQPRTWRWWIGAGVAFAVAFLAGHPQTFLFAGYAMVAWMLFLWIAGLRSHEVDRRGRALVQAVGSLALLLIAAGLSAAQALPSIEFTRLSVRANVDYDFVSGGFPLQDTWQLLLPGVLTTYSPLYVGVVGLGMAAAAAMLLFDANARSAMTESSTARRPASARAVVLFFGVLTLVALLLSYGGNAFLYPIFYRLAPGWNLFRGQERVAYLVALGLSVLAGYGAAALPLVETKLRHRTALIFGALVTVGVYAFGLIWQLTGRTAVGDWSYLGIATITLLLGIGYALLVWLEGWSSRHTLILTGLVLFNLFWANFATNLTPFSPARKTILAPEMQAIGAAVAEGGEANLGLPGRTYNEFRVYDDYGMRQQLEDVWGSSPLRLATYAALFDEFPLDRAWDLLGVEHVLTWRRELFEPATLLAEFPQVEDTTYLHRLTETNPRAWIASEQMIVDDATALTMLADHEFDLRRVALIASDDDLDSIVDLGNLNSFAVDSTPSINMERLAPNRLHVHVENANAPLLVVSENWMPGWRTSPPMPLVRTDLTLIGVLLPEPTVEFDLVYRPDSVRLGLMISGLTLLLIGLAVLMGRLLRPRRSPGQIDANTTMAQRDGDRCSLPSPTTLGETPVPGEALLSSASPRILALACKSKDRCKRWWRIVEMAAARASMPWLTTKTPHEWGWTGQVAPFMGRSSLAGALMPRRSPHPILLDIRFSPHQKDVGTGKPRIGGRGGEGRRDKLRVPDSSRGHRRPPGRKRPGYEATPHKWGWSLASPIYGASLHSPMALAWGGGPLSKLPGVACTVRQQRPQRFTI